jgi:hypothetical protein
LLDAVVAAIIAWAAALSSIVHPRRQVAVARREG